MTLQTLRYNDSSTVDWAPSFDWPESRVLTTIGQIVSRSKFERVSPQNSWEEQVESRLAKISQLKRGWDGYDAAPINAPVTAFAKSVLNSVLKPNMPAPSIVPTHGGGIQLEWHTGGLDIELMIYRPFEAELSVEFSDGQEPIEEQPLTTIFDSLAKVLEKLG